MIREMLNSIPEGTSRGQFQGRTYVVSKSLHNEGRSIKLFAEEAGGDDFISLNFYETSRGESLKPCEMPEEKVLTFLREFGPE
jgi:peptide-methionine (S)-S-oxide reductase